MTEPTEWANTHPAGDTASEVVRDLTVAATPPAPLPNSGRVFTVVPPGSSGQVIDLDILFAKHAPTPSRRRGVFVAADPASLAAYVTRHRELDCTEVWTDVNTQRIVAVLNTHEAAGGPVGEDGYDAGWGDFRAEFAALLTPEWKTWIGADNNPFTQVAFAEFIEDNLPDIVDPEPTTMLEIAQTFDSTASVVFKSQNRLSTGERQLVYQETVDARAGADQQLTIPESFTIGVQPFEGAAKYRITARLRFTMREGHLTLRYKLERPRDVLREAFDDVVTEVQSFIPEEVPVFRGIPAGPQGTL